ncbi:MAG TPA: Rrf2 family transcriptional regulator [Bryobacteraceae bacterium]|jgi:Rrf2 family protein|nr:Rrf2 family transcriptional regulator [Bryobacteraceae bacterium]
MNISVKSEYALKAVFDLSSQYLASSQTATMPPVKIADIAKRQKIPQKFLELILAGLKQSGFVDSRRGAEGGYLLARSPDTITVGDVLRAVENIRSSPRAHDNPFTQIWDRVDSAVSEVLDKTSFGEIAREWQQKSAKYVPNWDI